MTESDAQDILLGPATKPIAPDEWMVNGSTYTFAMPPGDRSIVCMDSAVFEALQWAARDGDAAHDALREIALGFIAARGQTAESYAQAFLDVVESCRAAREASLR